MIIVIIKPVFLYGTETWVLTECVFPRIDILKENFLGGSVAFLSGSVVAFKKSWSRFPDLLWDFTLLENDYTVCYASLVEGSAWSRGFDPRYFQICWPRWSRGNVLASRSKGMFLCLNFLPTRYVTSHVRLSKKSGLPLNKMENPVAWHPLQVGSWLAKWTDSMICFNDT